MTVEQIEIPTFWDPPSVVVTPHEQKAEEAFREFCRRNPGFMRRLACLAYDRKALGQTRISVKALFEQVRSDANESYRVNNDWTSLAARRLVELYPDLDASIELRKRKGEK